MKTNIHAQSGKLKAIILAAIVASTPAFAVTTTAVHYNTQPVAVSAGLPGSAKWLSFGRPSLTNDLGADWVGFWGRAGYNAGGIAYGIFDGPLGAPVQYVLSGTPVSTPDAPATIYAPSVYFTKFPDPVFGDPILDPSLSVKRGPWAVTAPVKPSIALSSGGSSSQGIWAGVGTKHRQVALRNEVITPSPRYTVASSVTPFFTPPSFAANTKIQSFTNLQMTPNGTLFFTAKLTSSGKATDSLWRYQFDLAGYNGSSSPVPPLLVIAVGETVEPDHNNLIGLIGTVTGIEALGVATDITASHGRVDATNSSIPIRYQILATNTKTYDVVAEVSPSGLVMTRMITEQSTLFYPALSYADGGLSFMGPDLAAHAKIVSTLTLLDTTPWSIPAGTKYRIANTNAPVFRPQSTNFAPDKLGLGTPFRYQGLFGGSPFSSTVSGYAGDPRVSIAFRASTDATANNVGIYSDANAPSMIMREVARKGTAPAGLSTSQYATFFNLSNMDGKGPLYEASFTGIPSGYGLWGCDPHAGNFPKGDPQLLIQKGVSTANAGGTYPTITSFQCLQPVSGSIGQRRAWTYKLNGPLMRPVLMKASFDGTLGITTGIVTATY